MDPDAALARLHELFTEYDSGEMAADVAEEALDVTRSLVEWLDSGGFPPVAWERHS